MLKLSSRNAAANLYRRAMAMDKVSLTGGSKRCLNLGSYNYLGFAAHDEYCTPRALATLEDDAFGVSVCR